VSDLKRFSRADHPQRLAKQPNLLGILRFSNRTPIILGMLTIGQIGQNVAKARNSSGLRQIDLAANAGLSRATIDALENGRASDIGVSKLSRVLAALGLELAIRPITNERPTLDELMKEDADDESLGR
jgi:DNA-binding XRE family transcriptional regulator